MFLNHESATMKKLFTFDSGSVKTAVEISVQAYISEILRITVIQKPASNIDDINHGYRRIGR